MNPRVTLLAVGTLVAFVLVPFLFWRGTWFGRTLTDEELERYLNDEARPRRVQHALVQISSRLDRRDPSVERFYPRIAALAAHSVPELRVTAAWLMGQDNQSSLFHETLRKMIHDADPLVRRNAALALSRFNDPACRPELRAMLRSYVLRAPHAGVLRYRLQAGDPVGQAALVARLETGAPEPVEIRAPLPGRLERKIAPDGARISEGDEILALAPSPDHVWEALRALYLVGTAEDLPDVERFAQPVRDWSERIAEQAKLTAQQIRSR